MIEHALGQSKLLASTMRTASAAPRADSSAAAFEGELSRADANARFAPADGQPLFAIVVAKFTPLLLTNMFETMLPRSEAVVGEGLAGDVWRSFLSQELGNVLARQMVERPAARASEFGDNRGDKT